MVRLGGNPKVKKLNNKEHIQELLNKFLEESYEIINYNSIENLVEEIVDLQEILDVLISLISIDKKKISILQDKKNAKWGSFFNGDFIEYIEIDENYPKLDYYETHPDKYPEIID